MNTFPARTSGFSLVEVLVYLGLFVLIVTSSIGLVFSLDSLVKQYQAETALYRSGTQTMEQLLLVIRQGDQLNVFDTIQASPSTGRIAVANPATSTAISKLGDELLLEINGDSYGNMLPSNVAVTGFTVYHYPQAVGEFARVILELTATAGDVTRTETFYGGSVIRGST